MSKLSIILVTSFIILSCQTSVKGVGTYIAESDFRYINKNQLNDYVSYFLENEQGRDIPNAITPAKFSTIFVWNDNIHKISPSEKKKMNEDLTMILADDKSNYINLYTHYVDIQYINDKTGKIERTYRLYLQKSLIKHLYRDLQENDKYFVDYNVFSSIKHKKNINLYMVNYEEMNKDNPRLHYYLAKDAMVYGLYDLAVSELKVATSLDPNFGQALHLLGYNLMEIGRYDDALAPLLAHEKINPNNIDTLFEISIVYIKLQDYHSAIEYLTRGIELDNQSYKFYIELGYVYSQLQNYRYAIKYYKDALQHVSEGEEIKLIVMFSMINSYININEHAEVKIIYENAKSYFESHQENWPKERKEYYQELLNDFNDENIIISNSVL